MPEQLAHVMLGSNPHADGSDGWPSLSGRTWDVIDEDAHPSRSWSLAANWERVGPGTTGWVHRFSGRRNDGALTAMIVFTGKPEQVEETGPDGVTNRIWYCDGVLRLLSSPIDASVIRQQRGWPGTAPYKLGADRFRNGMSLNGMEPVIFTRLLDSDDRVWLTHAQRRVPITD